MLLCCCNRFSRAARSVLPLSPNSFSKTVRGFHSIGRGCVGLRQESVSRYAQLRLPVQAPALAGRSMRHFERGQLRFLREVPAQQLIDRDVGDDLDFVLAAARRAGEKRSGSAGVDVIPARLDAGEDQHLVLVGGERFQIGESSKAVPSPLGVQYSMAIPLGT